MTSRLPIALLALTLLAAAAIALGGVRLAREERVVREPRDRGELDAFADRMQEELARLEDRYATHLEELAAAAGEVSEFELRHQAESIWGVRQISHLPYEGRAEFHLQLGDSDALPVPVFREQDVPLWRDFWLLDPAQLGIGFPGESGWLTPSDEFVAFWRSSSERRVAVVMIDRQEVAERITGWLSEWIEQPFAPMHASSGQTLFRGPSGPLAVAGAIPDSVADFELPFRTRFGEWALQSWDRRRTVVSYDRGLLLGTAAFALLVALAGGLTFSKLRSALRLAEQRVSFVNRVSHELRTPLTNILLNADLAAEGASGAARKRLGLVREEAGRLQRLIDNVLSFSKIRRARSDGSGALGADAGLAGATARHCALREVVDDTLAQFATALERKGIRMVTELGEDLRDDYLVVADGDAVAQILGNLISNVEKYAEAGGLVTVSLHYRGDRVVVRVADRGPGISKAQGERIFEPFHRIDDRVSEGSSGTGLGLAIARELAESYHGSLQLVDSDQGAGAVFELSIPSLEDAAKVIEFPDAQAS